MASYREISRYFLALFLLNSILSCASTRPYPDSNSSDHIPSVPKEGIYHTVKRGETLWQIANRYEVSIESLIRSNKLSDPNKIIVGQRLWIPRIEKVIHTPRKSKSLGFIWPVKGEVINYFTKSERQIRPGIDIGAPIGSDIVASLSGKVIFSGDGPGTLGKTVIIAHSDGFTTIYANNLENLVSVDQRVRRAERIARVGKPPRSPLPSLHFEIRKDTVPYNPLSYLPTNY